MAIKFSWLKEKNYLSGFLTLLIFQMSYLMTWSHLQGWPEKVKLMQKNWIGKSFGCEINFEIKNSEDKIKVFTTRPDTIFGASFIALSADHILVKNLLTQKNLYNLKKNVIKLVQLKKH